MVPNLVTSSYNIPPVNSLMAYTQAGNMGIPVLPPPQVIAPNTMANTSYSTPSYSQPQSSQPTYIPWPYPMPSFYPMAPYGMPPAYNNINMPQPPNPGTQPLPATDSKPPAAEQMVTPEVLSLSQIARGLQDKTSIANQEMAAENLAKLIRENPDFQKLKTGAPEGIVLKALHSPEPQVKLKTLVALADDKVLSVTPRVKSFLRRAKSTGNTTAVEQGFVDLILNKNGRPQSGYTQPSYASLTGNKSEPTMDKSLLPPELANNKEFANLMKQGINA